MKFTTTDFTSTKEILKFPDHYVAVAVTVDDTGITADADGKKIVPKGTIVGGAAASAIADDTQKVQKKNTSSVAATLYTGVIASNNAITFTAIKAGTIGNTIKVQLKNPGAASQALSVSIAGDTIVVSLATDAGSVITSTAADVIAAVNAHLTAKTLVSAANTGASTGAGVVAAVAATALAGGTDGNATAAEGVLLNDVDVTYGPAQGAMIIHGFINVNKLPEAPAADAKTALKGIFFID